MILVLEVLLLLKGAGPTFVISVTLEPQDQRFFELRNFSAKDFRTVGLMAKTKKIMTPSQ
jgi:hypothetical protein